ncbi:MAG: DUF1269 domain-containing protein [Acidimicrobiia bacterium]|nr:DUF1269 domain-containing protein [Acidimicrobiia bacterium]
MGPIDFAIFEFPGSRFNGAIAPNILDLVERGLITILDLVFVKKDTDGAIDAMELTDMDADEIGSISIFSGDLNELLSHDDIDAAGEILEPGSSAMFVVWENTWAAPLATAIYESGGVLASTGRIPALDLLAAIEG